MERFLASTTHRRPLSIKSHVDWFEVVADTDETRLSLQLASPEPAPGSMVSLSFRNPDDPTDNDTRLATSSLLRVPPISQMQERANIRRRICAPACIAMVLAYHGHEVSLATLAARTRHHPTRLFGVWPANMQSAATYGLSATCVYCNSLERIGALIDYGIPVPTSISYRRGQLPGAPIPSSAGHVLVVRGFSEAHAWVNDPAAKTPDQVPRSYELEDFSRAWKRHHRVIYLLEPIRKPQASPMA